MSIKKPQLILLVLFAVVFSIYQLNKVPSVRRSFASGINVSQYSSHGIVDRIINLKIETSRNAHTDSISEVAALISLPFDFDGELQYKWTLGQNLILKEGSLTGSTIKSFQKDKPEKIYISVEGFTPDNLRHIGFEIYGMKNNRRIFADGLISSQKEKSFEKTVQRNSGIKK